MYIPSGKLYVFIAFQLPHLLANYLHKKSYPKDFQFDSQLLCVHEYLCHTGQPP